MTCRLSVLMLFLTCCCKTVFALERTGLKAALERGLVTVQAGSTGERYHGKALRLKVRNTSKQALQLTVDPALVFRPADTTYQDLVVAGGPVLALGPNGETSIELQTFCGKSYASAPGAALDYRFLRQGDSALVKVVRFIRENNLYNTLGQSAVWVITNGHDLDGVYDPDQPAVSNRLLTLLAQLTGRPVPTYFKQYGLNTEAGAPAFVPHPLKLFAAFDWQLEAPKVLHIGIYDATGELVQPVIEPKEMARGGYKITVTFEAENVPPGNYYIRLMDGATVMKEQTVRVD